MIPSGKRLETWSLMAGFAIMAWGQWGFPANPDASFAFGAGLALVPTIRVFHRMFEGAVRTKGSSASTKEADAADSARP